MSQMFNSVNVGNSSRSTFDLSHHQVTTSDFGYLIPICCREMVPNDDFTVRPDVFVRLAPLAVPTYGKITCRVHHFFVPNRILYPHWDKWITGDTTNNNTQPPYFVVSQLQNLLGNDPAVNPIEGLSYRRGEFSRLFSNFGLDPLSIYGAGSLALGSERLNAFPFLAYRRIWMDYFMDSNIYNHTTEIDAFNAIIKNGGAIGVQYYPALLRTQSVCFKKDYFTTAKLHPQDGKPSVVQSSVSLSDNNILSSYSSTTSSFIQFKGSDQSVGLNGINQGNNDHISGFTIEALRAATSLQRYLERNNYVGTKLINRLLAHFGVAPTPERLDMAEFIGGSSFPIQIGDVTSTSFREDNEGQTFGSGLGSQAGKGVGAGSGESFSYHATEHGIFMSVMSILPDTAYYQGIGRMWSRGMSGDHLDYYSPEFENLGYQEILNKEVYVPQTPSSYIDYDPNGIFGYSPQYSDYKFAYDVLGGDFRAKDVGADMDPFHLFRTLHYDNDNPLALNRNFVECDNIANDYDRIFQVTDNTLDHFYFNINFDIKATRPMVGFAEPSLDSTLHQGDGNSINLPYGGTRL